MICGDMLVCIYMNQMNLYMRSIWLWKYAKVLVRTYIYTCIYIHTCICIYVHIRTHPHIIFMCVCVYINMCNWWRMPVFQPRTVWESRLGASCECFYSVQRYVRVYEHRYRSVHTFTITYTQRTACTYLHTHTFTPTYTQRTACACLHTHNVHIRVFAHRKVS